MIYSSSIKSDDFVIYLQGHLTSLVKCNFARSCLFFVLVCSEEFSKCYIMVDIDNLRTKYPDSYGPISWDKLQSHLCKGWSIVNIHSRTEQEFVSFYLHNLLYLKRKQVFSAFILQDFLYPQYSMGYAYLGKCHLRFSLAYLLARLPSVIILKDFFSEAGEAM